jgi:LEA14-like dessication related protein
MVKSIIKSTIIIVAILSVILLLGYIYQVEVNALNHIDITFDKVNFKDLTYSSFIVELHTSVYNPSDTDISGISSIFNIYVEDNYIGEGYFSNLFIPANNEIEKVIPIKIYFSGLADVAEDIIKNIIKGDLEIDIIFKGTISANVLFNLITFSEEFETFYKQ